MGIKVYGGAFTKLRQPFLKLVEGYNVVHLVVVDEHGNHIADLMSFDENGCYTHANALEELVENGFDLSGLSFDRFGSLLINGKEV